MSKEYFDKVEEFVRSNPLPLLTINDEKTYKFIRNLLPYSVGIEIECNSKYFDVDNQGNMTWNLSNVTQIKMSEATENFKQIPDIMSVDFNNSEQRMRIPAGINGIFTLYNLTNTLKRHAQINSGSGIHIHIDMTEDKYGDYMNDNFRQANRKWVLDELDTWKYPGTYNHREFSSSKGNWIVVRGKTMEIRIVEMTFDYNVLIKRIIHASSIVKRLKEKATTIEVVNNRIKDTKESFDYEKVLSFIRNNTDSKAMIREYELAKIQYEKVLEKLKPKEVNTVNINQVIKSRVRK